MVNTGDPHKNSIKSSQHEVAARMIEELFMCGRISLLPGLAILQYAGLLGR